MSQPCELCDTYHHCMNDIVFCRQLKEYFSTAMESRRRFKRHWYLLFSVVYFIVILVYYGAYLFMCEHQWTLVPFLLVHLVHQAYVEDHKMACLHILFLSLVIPKWIIYGIN